MYNMYVIYYFFIEAISYKCLFPHKRAKTFVSTLLIYIAVSCGKIYRETATSCVSLQNY